MNFLSVIQVSPECKQVSLTGVSIMGNAVCGRELTDADLFWMYRLYFSQLFSKKSYKKKLVGEITSIQLQN